MYMIEPNNSHKDAHQLGQMFFAGLVASLSRIFLHFSPTTYTFLLGGHPLFMEKFYGPQCRWLHYFAFVMGFLLAEYFTFFDLQILILKNTSLFYSFFFGMALVMNYQWWISPQYQFNAKVVGAYVAGFSISFFALLKPLPAYTYFIGAAFPAPLTSSIFLGRNFPLVSQIILIILMMASLSTSAYFMKKNTSYWWALISGNFMTLLWWLWPWRSSQSVNFLSNGLQWVRDYPCLPNLDHQLAIEILLMLGGLMYALKLRRQVKSP